MRSFLFEADRNFKLLAETGGSQAATMKIEPGCSVGGAGSGHEDSDRWLFVVAGRGRAVMEDREVSLGPGRLLLIEGGEVHQIDCLGHRPLEVLSIHAPSRSRRSAARRRDGFSAPRHGAGLSPRLTIDPRDCDAAILDMDGVVTDTARVHARAWKEAFDDFLLRQAADGDAAEPFDLHDDYARYVDGKPRYDGAASFLRSRGIELEYGAPDDPPGSGSVCGLGNLKNRIFLRRLREDGADRFQDAVDFVERARREGIHTAVISSSRNAAEVLEAAGVAGLFETRIDGVQAGRRGLDGKPAPDVFLAAARALGAEPSRSAVLEDALAGVEAGRAGGFRWVIGVARSGGGRPLQEAGADVVVADLAEIAIGPPRARGRSIDELPPALDHLDEIAGAVGNRTVAFFLDFDGTLAPIVQRPEEARLPAATRDMLGWIARRRPVAVVSGRDLDDVRERVGLEGLCYAGDHGLRLALPGGGRRQHAAAGRSRPALERAELALEALLAGIEGVEIERKGLGVAIHFRRAAAADVDRVVREVEVVAQGEPDLRVTEGRKVRELRPAVPWDKGRAIGWIEEALGMDPAGVFPLHIGDDTTDEDAFRAVQDRGLGIVVRGREGRSQARYALADPDAVRDFLWALDRRLGGP
jgi:alpha,alpha-trehalase